MIQPIVLETGENAPRIDDSGACDATMPLVPFGGVQGRSDAYGGMWASTTQIDICPITINEDKQ